MKRIYKAVLEFFSTSSKEEFASIVQNDRGGFSIEIEEIKIGNYASYADAHKVATKYNFLTIKKG